MFFDPVVQSQKALELWTQDFWTKATQGQLARFADVTKHFDAHTEQTSERTREAIDESARLMKASLDYGIKLSAEWRKVSMDLVSQATASVPKA